VQAIVHHDDLVPMTAETNTYEKPRGNQRIVFLAWAPHSARAKGICEGLGAQLYLMSYKFRSRIHSPIKYPLLFLRSLFLLSNQNPEIIICQTPPIFCPLVAIVHKLTHRKVKVVIDLHSGALETPWSYLKPLNTAVMKKAAAVLVSNQEAHDHVLKENDMRTLILEDKIPGFDPALMHDDKGIENSPSSADLTIIVPSSFANDEPIEEILNAAAALPETKFYLTGDSSKAGRGVLKRKPHNVVFTDFLKTDDYVRLLYRSDAIMVLTTRDKTLLAGGYEAVALGKPLITSNWAPLRRYFNKGAIHVNNSAAEIVKAVQTVQQKKIELEHEMGLLREEKMREWEVAFARFRDALNN